ncbi:MAG: hypothetical protein J07HX5_02072 [halophilic archaeon J07HX5]|nr:MAG: hypothetical protein J07HX5_02072 [halophilic archaeon J07HX5]
MGVKHITARLGALRDRVPWWYFVIAGVVAGYQSVTVFLGVFDPPFWPFADQIYAVYCAGVTVTALPSAYSAQRGTGSAC